jgi:hypothetical protein
MNLPQIKISHSKLLDPYFLFYYQNHPEWKDKWAQPSEQALLTRVDTYKEIWKNYGSQILCGICEFFEKEFIETVIEIYVVGGNHRAFSNPLVLSSRYNENEFLILIAHELIHRLLEGHKITFTKKLYPDLPDLTANHIIVHAALKHVYLDVLDRKDLLDLNLKKSEHSSTLGFPEYEQAWKIVEERGYKNLIEEYKKNY